MKMETTIPAELLDLKARLDQWRANRKYLHQPLRVRLKVRLGWLRSGQGRKAFSFASLAFLCVFARNLFCLANN
jgi:hypothetical protein